MNKLILIGNGFDLAHGLKTSYNDFILWLLNKSFDDYKQDNGKNENIFLKLEITKYGQTLLPIQSLEQFKEASLKGFIKIEYKNIFLQQLISNSIAYNWVDIESKYYSELVNLYKRLEKADLDKHQIITKELRILNSNFNEIKLRLIEYLSFIEQQTKIANPQITSHFRWETVNNIGKNRVLVLNFNYTSTVELYKEYFKELDLKIINIHGTLSDDENPVIFGYGDEMHKYYEKIEQLDEDEFLMNIKSFFYFKTSNYQEFFNFINSAPFEVGIMGHSCGLSDRILLNSIFENNNCQKINIFYHQKNANENDYFEKTQKISRHFKAESKANMRIKIVPFNNPKCVPLTGTKQQ